MDADDVVLEAVVRSATATDAVGMCSKLLRCEEWDANYHSTSNSPHAELYIARAASP